MPPESSSTAAKKDMSALYMPGAVLSRASHRRGLFFVFPGWRAPAAQDPSASGGEQFVTTKAQMQRSSIKIRRSL